MGLISFTARGSNGSDLSLRAMSVVIPKAGGYA